jgi:hypothetical protein
MGTFLHDNSRARTPVGGLFAWCALVVLVSYSCHGSDVVKPPEGPGTSYPCGVWGVSCGNGSCCPWAHICGLEGDAWRRCSVGYCCADGDPFYGAGADAGAVGPPRSVLKQRSPR